MQFTTELIARLPWCRCPEHGVKAIVPPSAGKHSRLTLLFEASAVEVRQACRTVKAAADLLGLSWDAVPTIMDRAVARGLERRETKPIKHVGIDQKNFGRGQDYITVLTDIDGSRVLDVAPQRTQAAAEAVLATLSAEQRQGICAVAADMLPAYAAAVANQLPNAELVHDKFHVAKHLGEAVDQVRRAENKALQAQDDDRLKGTRQLWLFNKSNLSREQRRRYDAIKKHGVKTARAWGDQRSVPLVLAARLLDQCRSLLPTVACVGCEVTPASHGQGGEDAQASSAKPLDLLQLPDHERHD